jgi:hypothetical protein
VTRGRPVAVPCTCWRRSRSDALKCMRGFGLKYAGRREIDTRRRPESDALKCKRVFGCYVVVAGADAGDPGRPERSSVRSVPTPLSVRGCSDVMRKTRCDWRPLDSVSVHGPRNRSGGFKSHKVVH